jgi:hypothetical protein
VIEVIGGQIGAECVIVRGALAEIHGGLLPEAECKSEVVTRDH